LKAVVTNEKLVVVGWRGDVVCVDLHDILRYTCPWARLISYTTPDGSLVTLTAHWLQGGRPVVPGDLAQKYFSSAKEKLPAMSDHKVQARVCPPRKTAK